MQEVCIPNFKRCLPVPVEEQNHIVQKGMLYVPDAVLEICPYGERRVRTMCIIDFQHIKGFESENLREVNLDDILLEEVLSFHREIKKKNAELNKIVERFYHCPRD